MRGSGIRVGLRWITAIGFALAAPISVWAAAEQGCQKTVSFEEFTNGVRKARLYLGGPKVYTDVGRRSLAEAIDVGLRPGDKVLDIGAGSLRVGWWLLQYIEPSNYYAIEPMKKRVDTAARIAGVKIHTFYNSDFEFPPERFDFVLARSIWTHASKAMISKMLSEFAENASPGASSSRRSISRTNPKAAYLGEHWIDHQRKYKGMMIVSHSRDWVEAEVAKHGLKMTVGEKLHGQIWVLVERAS